MNTTLGYVYRFFRRLKNRLKPVTRLKEMWEWGYESCERCGACFKIAYDLKDDVWLKIYGSDGGILCLNCAIERALKKGIIITPTEIKWLCLFYGDHNNGSSYDITPKG